MLETQKYLARLGLTAPVPHTLPGLRSLLKTHIRSIPFENIDPLLGIVPDLDLAAIQDKLLDRQRGGYCFEQNALFGCALREWGFAAEPLLARVRNGAPHGGARTHQAWIVAIDRVEYLADAGFGGASAPVPLRLDHDEPQETSAGNYRIRHDDTTNETVVDKWASTGWFSLYSFDRIEVAPVDFAAANHLCATWDQAPFRSNLMLALHTPTGRISAFNRTFRENHQSHDIQDLNAFSSLLTTRFGLRLAPSTISKTWHRIKDQPA